MQFLIIDMDTPPSAAPYSHITKDCDLATNGIRSKE